jgi:hypothetical protein
MRVAAGLAFCEVDVDLAIANVDLASFWTADASWQAGSRAGGRQARHAATDLVIGQSRNYVKTFQPWDVAADLQNRGIVVDAISLGADEQLCHLTEVTSEICFVRRTLRVHLRWSVSRHFLTSPCELIAIQKFQRSFS